MHTRGGAIILQHMNQAGLTLIYDSVFYENYGASSQVATLHVEGASVSALEGGILYAANNTFSMWQDPTPLKTFREMIDADEEVSIGTYFGNNIQDQVTN